MPVMVHLAMDVISCVTCGIQFGIMRGYDEELQKTHRQFFCPNGHPQSYCGETEADRLKKEAVRLQQRLDQEKARADSLRADRDKIERRLVASKGQQTKLRKRIAAGVCPCCHRTFKQLAAHMADVHPEFATTAETAEVG